MAMHVAGDSFWRKTVIHASHTVVNPKNEAAEKSNSMFSSVRYKQLQLNPKNVEREFFITKKH